MPQIANGDSGAAARAAINFVLPRTVPFGTTPPLDGNAVMAARTISSALAFTAPSGPALGAQCQVRLTADGANAPGFSGLTEHGSSAGYLNIAGVVNLVRFWHDGVTSWFAVSQALNAVPFVMQSGTIASATPTQIQILFDRALNASIVPATSAFVVTNSGGADTASTIEISGSAITLTKTRTTLAGDTVSLAYTAPGSNPLTDASGNVAGSSAISVTNNVGSGSSSGSSSYLRLPNLSSGMTETADGGGWDYVPPADDGGYGGSRVASSILRLSAGQDGGFYAKVGSGVTTASAGPLLALGTSTTPASFSDAAFAIYASSGSGANWNILGSGPTGVNSVAVAANDLAGLFRTGTGMAARVSKDGGTTWTTVATWSGVTTAALTAFVQTGANGSKGTIYQPVKTGTWA